MAEEAPDRPLLLELARESFRQQVAKRVRPLARSFVERWMNCELWLYPSVVQRHGNELHSYKAVVLETLRKTTAPNLEKQEGARSGLHRVITLRHAVALYVSSLLGSGIFVIPGLAARIAGPASILSWIILSIASYPFAYTFAKLSARRPESG